MEKKMFRKTLLLTLLLLIILTACSSLPPTSGNLTFTDGLSREITLNGPAQRVVSLAPSLTEVLFAIGAGAQVVGRDDLSDFPAEAASIASIGSAFGPLNTEAIVTLEPDLVVAAEINTPEQVKSLEDLGITVYYFKNPVDFDGLYKDLATMGALTGHEDEAAASAPV